MHRRRSRERRDQKPHEEKPRSQKPREPSVQGAPAAKRRGRADAPVPEELKLSARTKQPPQRQPARGPRPSEASASPRDSGTVLVTGFDCFGGESINPSWEICKRLPREIGRARIETCIVPCEFRRAIEVVAEAIQKHKPSLVISLGQAGGRSRIGVERVAINVDDARIADNAGQQPVDEAIAQNGPAAYFSTLPVKAMARAIRAAGVPAEVSNSAGTYVCNHVMYGVLHFIAASGTKARAGFIHVPFAEPQVLDKRDAPAMSLESMVKGITAAIEAAVTTRVDITIAEGALD